MSIGSASPSTGAARGAATTGSKQRLIDAAIEMILEHHRDRTDPREVFAFLNPGSIAERARLSRGLIYHHWGDVDSDGTAAFARFLDSVTSQLWERVTIPDDLVDLADLLPDNFGDVIVTLSTVELARLSTAEAPLARAILALSLYGMGSPDHTADAVDRIGRLYERVFAKLGREPVPPLTTADLAFTIMCLLDGFTANARDMDEMVNRRHAWIPHVPPQQFGNDWTLFAIAVESLALNMTRPAAATPPVTTSAAEELELATALRSGGAQLEHAAAQAEDEHLA